MSTYTVIRNTDELHHHGVKGMKWGVRKKTTGLDEKKTAYKSAKKEYKKSFNKAYNKAAAAYSPFKKHREANDARWEDAVNKAETLNTAKKEYKQAKKTVKAQEKQYGKLEDGYVYKKKAKEKDMLKAYGKIEDSLTYNKYANKKAESYASKALDEIDRQLSQTGKKPTYDTKKVNDFLDRALKSIDEDLAKYR